MGSLNPWVWLFVGLCVGFIAGVAGTLSVEALLVWLGVAIVNSKPVHIHVNESGDIPEEFQGAINEN